MTDGFLPRSVVMLTWLCAALAAQNTGVGFDGSGSSWVEVPDSASLVPATGITVEAWAYRAASLGGFRAILRKNHFGGNEVYNIRLNNGILQAVLRPLVNGGVAVSTTSVFPVGVWRHVALTFDNSVAKLYLNGIQIGQTAGLTGPLQNTGNTLRIGNGDSEPWSGTVDNVRIWSYARTQQEIQAMMFLQVEDFPGIVSSWHFNGNFLDSTGTNHGMAIGSVPFVAGAPLTPYLAAPASLSVGLPIVYSINSGRPSLPYVLDVSVAGTAPGVTLPTGLVIPLNPPWLNYETNAALANVFVGFFGMLDALGHASAHVNVPAEPMLAGVVVASTYVVINPANPALIDFAAPAASTQLVP